MDILVIPVVLPELIVTVVDKSPVNVTVTLDVTVLEEVTVIISDVDVTVESYMEISHYTVLAFVPCIVFYFHSLYTLV